MPEEPESLNDLRQALISVFPNKLLVVNELLRLLDSTSCCYRPLNLKGCEETNSGILACAINSENTGQHKEVWSSKYQAYTYELPYASAEVEDRVTFVRGLLVGVIDSDSNGSMYISGNCWGGRGRLVIAPPPDARLRYSSVWIRDWRYISLPSGPGFFEVLSKDIVNLSTAAQGSPSFHSVDVSLISEKLVENVRGIVRAKSCIVAPKSPTPCFLVELAESSTNAEGCAAAAVVVFHGSDAVKWWPFLWVGQDVGITGLRVSHLPRYKNRVVFRAQSPKPHCYLLSRSQHGEKPGKGNDAVGLGQQLKKRRIEATRENFAATASYQAQTLVTFEGEITGVLGEGKFRVDLKACLHLGDFEDACAGPGVAATSFRRGARIVASWLSFTVHNGQLNLFPTGRTSIAIQYFGVLDFGSKRITTVRSNIWRWIWKRWNFSDIAWADEMYCSLRKKLGPWLCDIRSWDVAEGLPDSDITRYLLGNRDSAGLVQFIMFLLSGRTEFLDTDVRASRDIYADFLSPTRAPDIDCPRPSAPSLSAVSEAVKHLWRNYARGCLENEKRPETAQIASHTQVVFQGNQILEVLRSENCSASILKHGLGQETVVLIGWLRGSSSGDRGMILSDATASVSVRVIGHIPFTAFEAIVAVSRFRVVAEATSFGQSCQNTFLFDAGSIQEVVTGTSYSGVRFSGLRGSPTSAQQPTVRSRMLPSVFTSYCIGGKPRISLSPHVGSVGSTVVNIPLVCIFIERLTPGLGKFTIAGHLVAVCEGPLRDQWTALTCDGHQFCHCSLALSGASALKFTSGFHSNALFAVSCTDLQEAANPVQYVQRKVAESLYYKCPLELTTHFVSESPLVLSLGRGQDMRFRSREACAQNCQDIVRRFPTQPRENEGVDPASDGYPAVIMKIEELSKAYMDSVVTSLWRAFSFSEFGGDEHGLSLRGTVEHCGEPLEKDMNNGCGKAWQLCIRDEKLDVFQITVNFYDRRFTPQGLGRGMVVNMQNVSRVRAHTGSRFRFVGNMATFVEVVSVPAMRQYAECQSCRNPPSGATILSFLKYSTLWEFSEWNEAQEKHSCEAGVVRFQVLRIEHLQMKKVRGPKCSSCEVRDRKGDMVWNVAISVVATIEDGSTGGKLLCKGFRNVTRLLGASREECMALKAMALRESDVEISGDVAETTLNVQRGERSANDCLSTVCSMMRRRRSRRVVALVLNQSELASPGTSPLGSESEVIMKRFRMGFGRLLWTSCSRRSFVVVECLAVYDCPERGLRCDDYSLSTVETLHHLLKEHS